MKKLNKFSAGILFLALTAVFCGCSNLMEELSEEKTAGKKISADGQKQAVNENPVINTNPKIKWSSPIAAAGNKSLWELAAYNCSKIVFGKNTDYADIILDDTGTYEVFDAGENTSDGIKAYYKQPSVSVNPNDFTTWDGELYVLADKKIAFEDDDLISVEDQTAITTTFMGMAFSPLDKPAGMFFVCQGLREIIFDNIDISDVTDISCLFYYDQELTSINRLSNLDTSNVTDMTLMFCSTGFSELDLSVLNTAKVKSMASIVSGCFGLQSVNLKGLNTDNVTDMSYMFASSRLTTVKVDSSFNTSNVTDMSGMFSGCSFIDISNLKSIISKLNTKKAENMSEMFNDCSQLDKLDLSNFNTSNVQNMYGMFRSCTVLEELNISTFDFSKVTDVSEMFQSDLSLVRVYVRAGTDLSEKTGLNSVNMFDCCNMLTGGNSTSCDGTNYIDKTYARVDGLGGTAGYFSVKS